MKKLLLLSVVLVVSALLLSGCTNTKPTKQSVSPHNEQSAISPYAGEETRGIKSLSQSDIEGLLAGHGTPFGGMAKLAELNGYPGPRHVLDLATELELSNSQKEQIENIYQDMSSQAIELGKKIIEIEQGVDDSFKNADITNELLKEKITESAELYGQLRYVHLTTHLSLMDILSSEQIKQYNKLRGYDFEGDPCKNIPEGHNAELWKAHNNCE